MRERTKKPKWPEDDGCKYITVEEVERYGYPTVVKARCACGEWEAEGYSDKMSDFYMEHLHKTYSRKYSEYLKSK